MYEYLISEYIKKMTINDVIDFAKKKNIKINESDAIILHSYAKKYYKDFLNGHDKELLKEIKNKINPDTYKEAYKLYIEYKMKYRH